MLRLNYYFGIHLLLLGLPALADYPAPPNASGPILVHEFYADVPWQQKLATMDGNSFTEPFAIPYDGLTDKARQECEANKLDKSDCILKYGIVNIIQIERTDTSYQSNEVQQCKSKQCVQVQLKVGNYSTQISGLPEAIEFGSALSAPPYKGYVISIGSIYAPQLPWYFSHQCSGSSPGNVCYEDYFTDIINTFIPIPNSKLIAFPDTLPWYVFNHDASNRCPKGQRICTIQLGALDLNALSLSDRLFEQDNDQVISAFNTSISQEIDKQKFPWPALKLTSFGDLFDSSVQNPFLGNFDRKDYRPAAKAEGPSHFLFPSQCSLVDLATNNVEVLRNCGINYEIHHGGFLYNADGTPQWQGSQYLPELNTYSRTTFMYAGIHGETLPVSNQQIDDLTIREKVETASIFTTYMPILNASGRFQADHRPYYTDFWHTMYLTNHRIMNVEDFTSGMRGKILFHNEYRSRNIYMPNNKTKQDQYKSYPYDFAASVDHKARSQRYSAKTCDACHVRNGSGIPLTIQKNSNLLVVHRNDGYDAPFNLTRDYTFTHDLAPMGLRFIELHPQKNAASQIFSSKVMNYYNNMFYVWGNHADGTFGWSLTPVKHIEVVDKSSRKNYQPSELGITYFKTPLDDLKNCQAYFEPVQGKPEYWPSQCDDVNAQGLQRSIVQGQVGFMLLNAPRIVGMNVLEAIPKEQVLRNHANQVRLLGSEALAGQIAWVPGSYSGQDIKRCEQQDEEHCYLGRFGWTLSSGTLEDQVSGAAAYPELNITQKEGASKDLPMRFSDPHCGPANRNCKEVGANSDLTEAHIKNLADYMRWLGVFNRSEYLVASENVIRGEQVFRKANCDTCHVISKIQLNAEDNMLPNSFRQRLASLTSESNVPFLSYIGTDLLMHDMGYLSQVAPSPNGNSIRDSEGIAKPEYKTYIQKFRTPPLMNLTYNSLVTDSHLNNKNCDFLLHDGRACDAIEAAFLHDGPAVKKLNTIAILNNLNDQELEYLRAFLYSL